MAMSGVCRHTSRASRYSTRRIESVQHIPFLSFPSTRQNPVRSTLPPSKASRDSAPMSCRIQRRAAAASAFFNLHRTRLWRMHAQVAVAQTSCDSPITCVRKNNYSLLPAFTGRWMQPIRSMVDGASKRRMSGARSKRAKLKHHRHRRLSCMKDNSSVPLLGGLCEGRWALGQALRPAPVRPTWARPAAPV